AFHAMVPSVLKGKYQKWIQLHPSITKEELVVLSLQYGEWHQELRQKKRCLWETALSYPGITETVLKRLIREKQIVVLEQVDDRTTQRKVRWVVPKERQQLEQVLRNLSPRKRQQKRIVEFFLERGSAVPL